MRMPPIMRPGRPLRCGGWPTCSGGIRIGWAAAQAAARSVPAARDRAWEALDRRKIEKTARTVAAAKARKFGQVAEEGWRGRADLAQAWAARRTGEVLLGEFTSAMAVAFFAGGQGWSEPRGEYMPADPAAKGFWLSLERVLHPERTWLTLPRDVEWPREADPLLRTAMGSPKQNVALSERGHAEVPD